MFALGRSVAEHRFITFLGPIVRGKYARRMATESNVVVVDPAVSKAFPNEESVNAALRGLLDLAHSSTRPTRSKRMRAG